VVPYSIHPDRVHSVYGTIGSGKAIVFQNGVAAEVTWHKASRTEQVTFTDAAGSAVALNPGQTWFTAVGSSDLIGFRGP
jgi:hypothetical protein